MKITKQILSATIVSILLLQTIQVNTYTIANISTKNPVKIVITVKLPNHEYIK